MKVTLITTLVEYCICFAGTGCLLSLVLSLLTLMAKHTLAYLWMRLFQMCTSIFTTQTRFSAKFLDLGGKKEELNRSQFSDLSEEVSLTTSPACH
jgi:hypothetical protein